MFIVPDFSYYLQREERTTCLQKIKNALRTFVSFLFTQVILKYLIFLFAKNKNILLFAIYKKNILVCKK